MKYVAFAYYREYTVSLMEYVAFKCVAFTFYREYTVSPMELCAELGVPELSQVHAGLALEPQQTVADVKVTEPRILFMVAKLL